MNSIPPPQYNYRCDSSSEPNDLLQYDPPPEYDYSPENGRLPESDSLSEYFHPSQHGYGVTLEISSQVDDWITGKPPGTHLNSCEKIHRLAITAKLHKSKITPLSATRVALERVFYSQRPRILGLTSLPKAVVCDTVKPPYHLARMMIALSQRNFERLRVEEDVSDEILESLYLSLEALFKMLVRLRLETRETLHQQTRDRNFYPLLTMARFLEAYGSRLAPSGIIYLASRKILLREHCSGLARLHFDQIHDLKEAHFFATLPPTHTPQQASGALEKWLPRVRQALKESLVDRDENCLFDHMVEKLWKTRDELPGLIIPVENN